MDAAWDSALEGSTHRFVLVAIADIADDAGYCWPSIRRLAAKTGLSDSSVKRSIRHLEGLAILARMPRWTSAGDQTSNGYRVNVGLLRSLKAAPPEAEDDDEQHPGAELFNTGGVGPQ